MTTKPRTVLHGVDQSCPTFADLPRANMASEIFTEDLLAKLIWDADGTEWLPMEYIPFVWDFDVHGGVVSAIDLGITVPQGTIILDGMLCTVKPLQSGGAATVAISVEGANDILTAVIFTTPGTEGLHDVIPTCAAANAVWVTVDRQVTFTIGGAPLTWGKMYGFLRCVRGFITEEASSSSSSQSSSSSSSSSSQSSSSSSSQSSSSSSSQSSSSSSNSSSSQSSSSSSSSQSSSSSSSQSSSSSSSQSSSSSSSESSSSSSNSSSSSESSSSFSSQSSWSSQSAGE